MSSQAQPPTPTTTASGGATTATPMMMKMSLKHRFSQLIHDYWVKNNDFVPLQDAGTMINQALRSDEENADLYRKIAWHGGMGTNANGSMSSSSASHLYFPYDPTTNSTDSSSNNRNKGSSVSVPTPPPPPPEQTLQHIQSIPLPTLLSDQFQKVRMYSSMGLFLPSSSRLAYMTVDHQLFVWSYEDPMVTFVDDPNIPTHHASSSSSSIISFSIPSGQCIISVGLVRPKKGKYRMCKSCCGEIYKCWKTLTLIFFYVYNSMLDQKGVFKSNVEWCLVVATPEEVLLCAIARVVVTTATSTMNGGTPTTTTTPTSNGSSLRYSFESEKETGNNHTGILQLVPTSFTLSTDNIRVLSIAGSENGRIFLGGDDGCLYEMTYELGSLDSSISAYNRHYDSESSIKVAQQLEQFYDHDGAVPEVIMEETTPELIAIGKRAWSTLKTAALVGTSLLDQQQSQRPRKCAKINRTASTPTIVKAIVPDFILRGTSFVFGGPTSAAGGKIMQIVIDEHRGCIYTLSTLGWICTFDLNQAPGNNSNNSVMLTAVIDTPRTARLYLEAVSRGQGFPPSSNASQTIGHITFPGGGVAAQAGVGGMDGARTILKHEDMNRQQQQGSNNGNNNRASGGNILKPTSIHVIAPTESSRLTLVAVTECGLRYYLSSLSSHVISNGADAVMAGRYGTRAIRNPLSPSNRITLCHIRAPPPTDLIQIREQDFSSDTCSVVGGITPRLSRSKAPPLIHSAFYKQGSFVIATANSERVDGFSTKQYVGDQIVATCPDSIARKLEEPLSSTSVDKPKDNGNVKGTLAIVGGISESVSISGKFAGGIVCDIVDVCSDTCAVYDLIANSTTPSDNELSIGLPPPYYPPSKTKPQVAFAPSANGKTRLNGQSNSTHSSIVSVNAPSSTTAFKVFGNVVTNLLLSRPLSYGFSSEQSLHTGMNGDPDEQPNYRLSSRVSAKGFSTSAGEEPLRSNPQISMTTKQHIHSRSARLRPWLLRPSTVPLNQTATHVYKSTHNLVALNTGGLHYFGRKSVMTRLAETLIRTTNNIVDDSMITSFFNGYGYKEGCCMCLALAIGCGMPPGSVSELLKSRAIAAALSRAYLPKITIIPDHTSGPLIGGVVAKDPLIPDGYDFKASALCEGLISLFSRLVRPIWHKPAVVVTEGRMIKLRWSEKMVQSPAKVETIFDDNTLQEIGELLRNLLMLMKAVFSRAIKSVPGLSFQTAQYMDIDDQDDNNLLTKSIQYNINLRNASTGLEVQLSHIEAEHIARQLEEKTIHSLYRVLARLVQLLNLMSLLRRAQYMVEFKEVDWGLLHGLTIAQLVQCPEAQDRLENLLNSLVTISVSKQSNISVSSAQADQLANLFADQCYLFFSPASRYAYLGLRSASEAMSLPTLSPNRNALVIQAAQYLRQAAMHWHSEPLVTGRMIHSKGRESCDQIARRAIECGSPLARATEVLMELEDVATVVEVCLITASNFIEKRSMPHTSINGSFEGNYELKWEHNLYHKRRDELLADGGGTLRSPAATTSSAAIVALGAEVTGQAAIDSCYALIFYHLSALLSAGKLGLADSMVSACAADSSSTFLKAFFSYLLENEYTDTLLRIDSSELCQWLIEKNDSDLLWRYYTTQQRYRKAGQVAFVMAKDRSRLSLTDRIEWLSRSLNSYESAMDGRLGSFTPSDLEDTNLKAKEVGDALQVAQLQYRILNAIDLVSLKQTSADLYDKLNNELLPVSELYNDYAAAFSLYDECLLIVHACRFEDVQTIQTLWTNVFCEEILPCATRNEDLFRFLESFVSSDGMTDMVRLIRENEDEQSFRMLESGDWEKPLARRIVSLGKLLYGKGASYVFPVEFILFNLERT